MVCAFTFGSRSDDLAGVFGGKYLEEVGQSQFEIRDNFNPFTVSTRQCRSSSNFNNTFWWSWLALPDNFILRFAVGDYSALHLV